MNIFTDNREAERPEGAKKGGGRLTDSGAATRPETGEPNVNKAERQGGELTS